MLGSLFILDSISGIPKMFLKFPLGFVSYQQSKFYASVMKSNLFNVQRLSLSSFMA